MNKILCAVAAVLLSATLSSALEIEGVEMPDTLEAGKYGLILNGAGVRTKLFMDLYVAGLYLKAKSSDAETILAADEPMAIRLEIVSGMITSEKSILK